MINRALRILPALNNVLSKHGTPMSANEAAALTKLAEVLEPFKRGILLLCKSEATLIQADRVFLLIFAELESCGSALADMLSEKLKDEIVKRRTGLSTVLEVLENPDYDFSIETAIGQRRPSDEEMLTILANIVSSDVLEEDDTLQDSHEKVRCLPLRFFHERTLPVNTSRTPLFQAVFTWESVFDRP